MTVQTKMLAILAVTCLVCAHSAGWAADDSAVARQFDQAYAAWRTHLLSPEVQMSSDYAPCIECPEFEAMAQLGVPVVGLAIAKTKKEPDRMAKSCMYILVLHVTKKVWAQDDDPVAW